MDQLLGAGHPWDAQNTIRAFVQGVDLDGTGTLLVALCGVLVDKEPVRKVAYE